MEYFVDYVSSLNCGDCARKRNGLAKISLTFDNGPNAEVTPAVLDILKRREVCATFFALGRELAQPAGRRALERARAEGHRVGNHTWSHAHNLAELDEPELVAREIGATQRELGALAEPDRLFRPFGNGGRLDRPLLGKHALHEIARLRLTCVFWNLIVHDWSEPDGWVDRALEGCRRLPHVLLVVHDAYAAPMQHLDRFAAAAKDAGHLFVEEFPEDCVPIRDGRAVGQLAGLASVGSEAALAA